MATVRKLSAAERTIIEHALKSMLASVERAERAAKAPVVAAAYESQATEVRNLIAALMSKELEF